MPADTARGLIFGALMIHGLGHGGALGALTWIAFRPGDPTGGWSAARSWLLPALPAATATAVASGFWIVSMLGFVAAALSFWGIVLPGEAWRPLAIGAAVVSLVGIGLFFGTWPPFNTIAALTVNALVLICCCGFAGRQTPRSAGSDPSGQIVMMTFARAWWPSR